MVWFVIIETLIFNDFSPKSARNSGGLVGPAGLEPATKPL